MKRQPRTPLTGVRRPLLRKEKLPEMPSHTNTHIPGNDKDETWLVKRKDADADARRKPVKSQLGVPPACRGESVLSGRTLDDLDELP